MLSRIACVALLAGVFAPARAAGQDAPPSQTVADLFPPGTLAFAEIHKAGELAPHLAALVKGTPLEDTLAFIHNRRDKATKLSDIQGKQELALLALFASPEMLAELQKAGIGVGLLGFTDLGEPEVALAVRTTPALGVAARAFLTMDTTTRKVGAVGTVPVYQFRNPSIVYDNNTGQPKLSNDKPPVEGPHEPTFAYTPGLFVVGSSKKSVGEVVARFRGEAKETLLGTPLFKDAVAAYRQPGAYFFVNAPEFGAKFEAAGKKRGDVAGSDIMAWVKLVANGKAMKTVAGCATFRDGGLSVQLAGGFDPAAKSPLLDLLSVPGVKVELLHHAPRPATFAASVTLPAANRSAVALAFLDALAKAEGELGRLPSEAVKELQAKTKVQITSGLIDKTRAVTVVVPARQELPKGTSPLPMLVLHAEDTAAAAAWEAFAPLLFADLAKADSPPQPSSETIDGVKVFSLPGAGLPWKGPVHFARKDAVFAVGLDRRLVAQAALGDAGASVAGGSQPLAPPTGGAVVLLGTVAAGEALRALTEPGTREGPVVPLPAAPPVPPGVNAPLPPQKLLEEMAAARRAFFASFGSLPPGTLTARRTASELRVELFQPKLQGGGLAPVIAAGVGWFDKFADAAGPQGGYQQIDRFGGRRRLGQVENVWGKLGEP